MTTSPVILSGHEKARGLLLDASGLAQAAATEEIAACLPTLRRAMKALEDAERLILNIPTIPAFHSPCTHYDVQTEFTDTEV